MCDNPEIAKIKESNNKKCKKYYYSHKEKIASIRKEYYNNHKEQLREYNKKYKQENRDKLLLKKKEYYNLHKEQIKEKNKNKIKTTERVLCNICNKELAKGSIKRHRAIQHYDF